MKQTRWMLFILFVLLIIIGAVENIGTLMMPIKFKVDLMILKSETPDLPLSLIVVIAFLTGMFSSGFYGIVERYRLNKRIKIMKKEALEKDNELISLRNLPVTIDDTDVPS